MVSFGNTALRANCVSNVVTTAAPGGICRVTCVPSAGSDQWQWQVSSGKGRVFSWIITHQAMHPKFREETPYATLVVEMEEGVRFVSRPLGIGNDELALDMPVEVVFEPLGEELALPLFRRAR